MQQSPSAFDEITDATIHAVDEAAAAGTRFVADGDGEVYFDGRLLTGGERIAFGQWDRYPPTPSLNIMITDPNGNYVQQALFVDKSAQSGPLYYRVMNAYTHASDGTRVGEWLLIVEDPVAGTAITITGANFTPGAGIGEGFLGLSASASVTEASAFMLLSVDAVTSDGHPQMASMDADAFVESLGRETTGQTDLVAEAAANGGLGTADRSVAGMQSNNGRSGIAAPGAQPDRSNIGNGRPVEVLDLSAEDQEVVSASLLAGAASSSGGFLGIGIVEAAPIPDTTGDDVIRGTKNNDVLVATEGNDTLRGQGGDDLLDGGWGADLLDGSSGTDTVTYGTSNAGVQVDLASGFGSGGHAQGDTLLGIENVTGSGYADSLYGNSGNNILIGQAGNDYFEARGGTDTFDGGKGNDAVGFAYNSTSFVTVNLGTGTFGGLAAGHTYISIESFGGTNNAAQGDTLIGSDERNDLYGYAGNDLISGAGGDDLLNGGDGADTIDGGVGNDLIQGAAGADRLTGGAGFDVFRLSAGDSGSLSGTWDVVTDFARAEDSIEISAAAGFRWIGTDVFEPGLPAGLPYDLRYEIIGNDTHVMADTNRDGIADLVVVLNGVHALDATDFHNTIVRIKTTDPILGTTGDDVIDGTAYGDVIDGLAGNDTISGQGSGDTISGGDGNDRILGGDGNDTIDGGLGLDTLFGDAGMDELHGGDGNDTIYSLADDDTLFGDTGNDSLMGGRGNDMLYGGPGNDSLEGETGDDVLFGEDGDDVLFGDSTFEWVENTRYASSPGNDTLYGGAGNDRLYGDAFDNETPGNDFLYGEDGDDTLSGGFGTNYFDGGTGYDILDLSDNDDGGLPGSGAVVVDMVARTVTRVDNSMDSFINIEGVKTTAYNDVVYGDSGNNRIDTDSGDDIVYGGAGDDTLQGGDGNDQHFGEDGDDLILGSIGADYFDGGAGIDTLDFSYTTAGATFDLASETVAFAGGQVETARAFENVIAGGGADSLIGTSAANKLVGSAGNDTLIGGAGDDTLEGGDGNDQHFGEDGDDLVLGSLGADYFDGGAGIDTLDFSYTAVGATFDLVSETVVFEGGQVETARAFENVIGGGGADRLIGTSAANGLVGNAGNDTLIGGAGDDILEGGSGADQFVFTSTASGVDVITDFNGLNGGSEEGDVLCFEGMGVGIFAYLGVGDFTGGSDNSEARVSGNQVLVDSNGDGLADITITLAGLTNSSQLNASDFLFV